MRWTLTSSRHSRLVHSQIISNCRPYTVRYWPHSTLAHFRAEMTRLEKLVQVVSGGMFKMHCTATKICTKSNASVCPTPKTCATSSSSPPWPSMATTWTPRDKTPWSIRVPTGHTLQMNTRVSVTSWTTNHSLLQVCPSSLSRTPLIARDWVRPVKPTGVLLRPFMLAIMVWRRVFMTAISMGILRMRLKFGMEINKLMFV